VSSSSLAIVAVVRGVFGGGEVEARLLGNEGGEERVRRLLHERKSGRGWAGAGGRREGGRAADGGVRRGRWQSGGDTWRPCSSDEGEGARFAGSRSGEPGRGGGLGAAQCQASLATWPAASAAWAKQGRERDNRGNKERH
jgi:hypothetical protein